MVIISHPKSLRAKQKSANRGTSDVGHGLFQETPVGPACHIVKIFRVDLPMICQVNDYRVSKGLTPLVVSPSLIGLAVIKSNHPGNKLQGERRKGKGYHYGFKETPKSIRW